MNIAAKFAPYAKFITSIIGIGMTIVSAKYGGASWLPYAVGAASALGVYGVPNTPKPPAVSAPPEAHP